MKRITKRLLIVGGVVVDDQNLPRKRRPTLCDGIERFAQELAAVVRADQHHRVDMGWMVMFGRHKKSMSKSRTTYGSRNGDAPSVLGLASLSN